MFYEDIRNRRRRRSSPDFVGQLSQLALRDVDPESGAYDYADHVDRRRKKLKRTKSHSTPTHSSQTSERRSSQTTSVATDATPSSLAMDRLQAVEAERDKLATEINQVQVLAQRRSNEQVRELHRLSKEVQHWRWEREQLAGSLNLSHERTDRLAELNSTLVKEVEELQRQKHDLERSLAEARSFAATIDVADLAQAITKLKDLNQLVDDIAFSIFSDLPDEVIQSHKASRKVTKPLRDLLASELVAGYALVGHVDRLGQSKDSSKIEDWLIPLLKTIIYEYLSLHIFSRFHPSIANSTVNEALHSIMSNLQQTGTCTTRSSCRVHPLTFLLSYRHSGSRRSMARHDLRLIHLRLAQRRVTHHIPPHSTSELSHVTLDISWRPFTLFRTRRLAHDSPRQLPLLPLAPLRRLPHCGPLSHQPQHLRRVGSFFRQYDDAKRRRRQGSRAGKTRRWNVGNGIDAEKDEWRSCGRWKGEEEGRASVVAGECADG